MYDQLAIGILETLIVVTIAVVVVAIPLWDTLLRKK